MKNLRTTLLCVCLQLCGLCTLAQVEVRVNEPDMNKPKLFNTLPEKITVNPEKLAGLLTNPVGTDVNILIGDLMPFQGRVVSSSNTNDLMSSIVIRSTNYPEALLTFSRAIIDGIVTYSGRILSMKHGDLFELQLKNGEYIFIKKNFYDLVNE